MYNEEPLIENIELSLPLNPAYVSAARLTASSIANRMSFHLNEIEDIKVAVSEVCTLLIKKTQQNNKAPFKINFILNNNLLEISILAKNGLTPADFQDEMGLVMINALVDFVELKTTPDNEIQFILRKVHQEAPF